MDFESDIGVIDILIAKNDYGSEAARIVYWTSFKIRIMKRLFMHSIRITGILLIGLVTAHAQETSEVSKRTELEDAVRRLQKAIPAEPPYYFKTDTFTNRVSTVWVEVLDFGNNPESRRAKHDDFYAAATGFRASAQISLIRARRFIRAGNADAAQNSIDDFKRQIELFNLSKKGAYESFEGSIEQAHKTATQIREASKVAALAVAKLIGPTAVGAIEGIYTATEFAIDTTDVDMSYATRQAFINLAVDLFVKHGPIDAFGGRSLQDSIESGSNSLVGRSGLYNVFDEVIRSQEVKEGLMRLSASLTSTTFEELSKNQINKVVSSILDTKVDVFAVSFDEGQVRTNVSDPYYPGAVTIADAVLFLQGKTGSTRWSALRAIEPKLGKNIIAFDAVALAGAKDDGRFERNIAAISDHLPNPMGAQDIAVIVKDTSGKTRHGLARILVPRMLSPASLDELSLVIGDQVDSYYSRMWLEFKKLWPASVSVGQAKSVLSTTTGSSRRLLCDQLKKRMIDTISPDELMLLSGGHTNDSYSSCAQTFVDLLQREITIEDYFKILGDLKGSARRSLDRELQARLAS